MVAVIKKGASEKAIGELLSKLLDIKGLNAFKYCGILEIQEEPLEIQKKMRDDWK
jgi:hypothetical protein